LENVRVGDDPVMVNQRRNEAFIFVLLLKLPGLKFRKIHISNPKPVSQLQLFLSQILT
jgi:hypothetical protein